MESPDDRMEHATDDPKLTALLNPKLTPKHGRDLSEGFGDWYSSTTILVVVAFCNMSSSWSLSLSDEGTVLPSLG